MAAQPRGSRGRGRPVILVMYAACMRNHAIPLGSYAVDGCGEFLPTGVDGTPEAVLCAACNCHRNFHQRVEMEIPPPPPRRRAPRAARRAKSSSGFSSSTDNTAASGLELNYPPPETSIE